MVRRVTFEHADYLPQMRAERVITAGRMLLAALLAVAVALDPITPGYAALLEQFSLIYLGYSGAVLSLTWLRRTTPRHLPLVTHVVDLVVFSAMMYLSAAPTSPFFVYLIFSMVCGALRWHGRGALLTGAAALMAYLVLTVAGRLELLVPYEFDQTRFITRCAHLTVITGLLAYLGSYQRRLQTEIASLAAWPRRLPAEESAAVNDVLRHAAAVLNVPRVVLVWQEGDEPALRVAASAGDRFELTRERPDAFGPIVSGRLQHSSFFCDDTASAECFVVYRVPGGFESFRAEPLDAAFVERFSVRSVLALRIATDTIDGRLFALDRRPLAADDILHGDIVGRLVAGALEQQALIMQLRDSAVGEERLRLARELHDGVLQSLTAVGLQLDRLRSLPGLASPEAQRRLAVLEDTIGSEHRSLRQMLDDLQPGRPPGQLRVKPEGRLRELMTRLERQWEVRLEEAFAPEIPAIAGGVMHELARMTEEAIVNAVRHGAATAVRVALVPGENGRLHLTVSYRGRGFASFSGRQGLAALRRIGAGPRTLMERVVALGGDLTIDSSEGGASIEIVVGAREPIQEVPAQRR